MNLDNNDLQIPDYVPKFMSSYHERGQQKTAAESNEAEDGWLITFFSFKGCCFCY